MKSLFGKFVGSLLVPLVRGLVVWVWLSDYYSISYLFSSFDLRRQSLDSHGKIWASETNSEVARAQLHIHSEPTAVLALHGVTQEDAGTYNCRVDFKKSPTRYRKIALDVIGKFKLCDVSESEV